MTSKAVHTETSLVVVAESSVKDMNQKLDSLLERIVKNKTHVPTELFNQEYLLKKSIQERRKRQNQTRNSLWPFWSPSPVPRCHPKKKW